MAKTGLLVPLQISRPMEPGRYGDGGGLYLQVKPSGAKSWLFRYQKDGKPAMMGLGPFTKTNSLATARTKAAALRALLENGVDPRAQRKAEAERLQLTADRARPFKECAEAYIAANEPTWKNAKHRQQWRNTMKDYVYPVIGDLAVSSIDEAAVLKVLFKDVKPELRADGSLARVGGALWNARPDTARRVRGRIELVLDWARAHKYRDGDNPARWGGNLKGALPKRAKRSRRHHSALPFEQMPEFMAALREKEGVSALALEFLILNAPRTNETLGGKWPEIDEGAALWTIPEERMKADVEHRIPLAPQSLAVLEKAKKLRCKGDYIFPGARAEKPLSISALLELVKPMGFTDKKGRRITVHGFRSTFRDWVAECTDYPPEVAEMALAHTIDDEVVAAYRRGELLEKRRALMEKWATYCTTPPADNVVQFSERVA